MIRPSTSNARASTQAVGPAHALGFIRFLVSGRPTAPRYAACRHTRGVTTCGRPWGPGQGSGQWEALLALPRMLLPSAQQGFQLRGARALREEAVGGPPEPRPDHQQSSPSPVQTACGSGQEEIRLRAPVGPIQGRLGLCGDRNRTCVTAQPSHQPMWPGGQG